MISSLRVALQWRRQLSLICDRKLIFELPYLSIRHVPCKWIRWVAAVSQNSLNPVVLFLHPRHQCCCCSPASLSGPLCSRTGAKCNGLFRQQYGKRTWRGLTTPDKTPTLTYDEGVMNPGVFLRRDRYWWSFLEGYYGHCIHLVGSSLRLRLSPRSADDSISRLLVRRIALMSAVYRQPSCGFCGRAPSWVRRG
jgi:hypothetical protein